MLTKIGQGLIAASFVVLIVFMTLAFAWNTLGLVLWGVTLFLSTMFIGGVIGVVGQRRDANGIENR